MRGEPQARGDAPGESEFDGAELDETAGTNFRLDVARWEDADPSFGVILRRLRRALAKSRLRSTWLIATFLAGVVLTLAVLHTRKAAHVAQVTFRMKDIGGASLEATDAQLKEMVSLNYLTQSALLAIIDEHTLYAGRRARAPYLAVASFRDDIRVQAVRYEQDGPATTERLPLRVTITFVHADGAIAQAVAKQLTDLVLGGSRANLSAKHQLALIHTTTGATESAFRRTGAAHRTPERPPSDPNRAKKIEDRLREAVRDRAAAELRAAEDLTDHALEFEVIDSEVRPHGGPPPLALALAIAVGLTAAVVALGSVLLGAGTGLVMDETDLLALDLPTLVTLPLRSCG